MLVGATLAFDGRPGRGMRELAATARHAEDVGLSSVWMPEHVVFLEHYESRYPYNESGSIDHLGKRPGVYDPLIALSVAATVTERIRLGTGVLVLPQREPVTLAQQAVALDHAADGRFDFGIGVGWLREEFDALGVPWPDRGARADEYIQIMRKLWTDDIASHNGRFVDFDGVLAYPKPVQAGGPPIWVGGNTAPALDRAAKHGDGWFGWNLTHAELVDCIAQLRRAEARHGRPFGAIRIKLGIVPGLDLAPLREEFEYIASLGVEEAIVAVGARGIDQRDRLDALAAAM